MAVYSSYSLFFGFVFSSILSNFEENIVINIAPIGVVKMHKIMKMKICPITSKIFDSVCIF